MIPDHITSPFREVTRLELESLIYRIENLEEAELDRQDTIKDLEDEVSFIIYRQRQMRHILRRLVLLSVELAQAIEKQKTKIDESALVDLLQSFVKLSLNDPPQQ